MIRLFNLLTVLVFTLSAFGQQPGQPTPSIPSTGFAGLDQYRASRIAVYADDFGQLSRYRDANAALKPPAPGENRVVFLATPSLTCGASSNIFPASLTSTAALEARPRRRCWCASARM